MICPICQAELTQIGGETWYGYECRAGYIYLEKDYPVCHYAYRHYFRDRKPEKEHRYIFFPFIIHSYPKENQSDIDVFYKTEGMNHLGMRQLITTDYITPDISNLDSLLEKLNLYLTFS